MAGGVAGEGLGKMGWADIGSWAKTSWDMLPHPPGFPPPAVAPARRAMLTYEGKFRDLLGRQTAAFLICLDTGWRAHTSAGAGLVPRTPQGAS